MKKKLKVALIHDYLREYGGAERVLEALHEIFPEAPVYVSFVDSLVTGVHWQKFQDWDIRQTWLAKVPLIKKLFSPLRILADRAFMSLDLSEYDLVISSSNMYEAKAVKVPNGVHINYCHTPPRALYGYSTMTNWKKNPLIRLGGTLINHYMRIIDFKHAQRVDRFIANSKETQRRIKKFYRRESQVIYPPIQIPTKKELERYQLQARKHYPTEYYLYLSRLAFNKHPELAVQAANRLGFGLKVVGQGKMLPRLKEMAEHNVEFLGEVDDKKLHLLLAGAKGLIYPVENEDFGMVPVEAMVHGVGVIAHASGGPMESVIEGQTGVFFDELSVTGLMKAIREYEELLADKEAGLSPAAIRAQAKKFGVENFQQKIKKIDIDSGAGL